MTVVTAEAKGRTMDFNPNYVGLVPTMAGHRIENNASNDLIFLEVFRTWRCQDISLNQWIARMPGKIPEAQLKFAAQVIRTRRRTSMTFCQRKILTRR